MPVITPPGGATIVKISGTPVSVPQTIQLERLNLPIKGVPTATFVVKGGALPATDPYRGKTLTITITPTGGAATLYFSGFIASVQAPYHDGIGWVRRYQCHGIRDYGNWVRHTDENTGSTTSVFNASVDNQGPDYLASRSGRTVGQILSAVLLMNTNANALDAYSLGQYTGLPTTPALPSATVTDLAALTFIPQQIVTFGSDKLFSAIEGVLEQHAPNHAFCVLPDGTFRFLDQRTFSANTLTMGTDPIGPVVLSSDTSNCASNVTVYGSDLAEMANFSLSGGFLSESPFAHDGLTIAQAKAAWTPADWQQPGLPSGQATAIATLSGTGVASVAPVTNGYGYAVSSSIPIAFTGGGGTGAAGHGNSDSSGTIPTYTITAAGTGYTSAPNVIVAAPQGANSDTGTCTCPSTTTITVTSANPVAIWPSNFWDQATGRHGVVYLTYSAGSSVTAIAGPFRITTNTALTAGGTSTITLDRPMTNLLYDGYQIVGLVKGATAVWRVYALPSWAGPALARQSTFPAPYSTSDGDYLSLTSLPIGAVLFGDPLHPSEVITGISVDASNGTVTFGTPTYIAAGNAVPIDVRALVPIYTAVNVVEAPPRVLGVQQFAGTFYTVDGVSRVQPVFVGAWRDPANYANMQTYANNLLDARKNIVYEGTVTYHGLYATALLPGASINIAGNGYTTGYESLNLPIMETQVDWPTPGEVNHVTTLHLSNRRGFLNAESFLRPDRAALTQDHTGSTKDGNSFSAAAGPDTQSKWGDSKGGQIAAQSTNPGPDVDSYGVTAPGATPGFDRSRGAESWTY